MSFVHHFFPWKSACFSDFPLKSLPADWPSALAPEAAWRVRSRVPSHWRPAAAVLVQKSFPWWWIENNIFLSMVICLLLIYIRKYEYGNKNMFLYFRWYSIDILIVCLLFRHSLNQQTWLCNWSTTMKCQ